MTPDRRRVIKRAVLATSGVLVVAVLLVAVPVGLAWSRVERVPLAPTSESQGATFTIIVGTDGRPAADDALLAPSFGDLATVEGERADLVVVARTGGGRPDEMLVVPRDVVIDGGEGPPGRLAVDWRDGPQAFVDRLCLGTGLPVDHLVALDAESLVRLVDASGGLDVNVINRIRDPRSKLAPIGPGQVRLDGLEALAWVRSRNPEVLTPEGWRPIAVPAKGSLLRNERTPAVIRSVTARMLARPWSSLPALPGIAATVRVDDDLGLAQVVGLARQVRSIPVVIPEIDQGSQRTPSARITSEGQATVAEFIGDERCTPSPS
jgi:hypothetical protein